MGFNSLPFLSPVNLIVDFSFKMLNSFIDLCRLSIKIYI